MNRKPPRDPHAGKTPLNTPLINGLKNYQYVEDLEQDYFSGLEDLSSFSDQELRDLERETINSPLWEAIKKEQRDRQVKRYEEPLPDVEVESALSITENTDTSSTTNANDESEEYTNEYIEGYISDYQE